MQHIHFIDLEKVNTEKGNSDVKNTIVKYKNYFNEIFFYFVLKVSFAHGSHVNVTKDKTKIRCFYNFRYRRSTCKEL